jgi:hypothetical protein
MGVSSGERRWLDPKILEDAQNVRYKRERIEEVKYISRVLQRLTAKEVRESEKYFPLRFLGDGFLAYIEFFDNASIWYSSLAVEVALTVRLGPAIDTWGKPDRRPSFKQMIDCSPDDMLSSRMKATAHKIRKLRNCYIHYYNIMYDQQIIKLRFMKALRKAQATVSAAELQEMLKTIEALGLKPVEENLKLAQGRDIPLIERLVDPETKRFTKARYTSYLRWLKSAKTPEYLKGMRLDKVFAYYGIERFDALSCLKDSFKVLRHLKFV